MKKGIVGILCIGLIGLAIPTIGSKVVKIASSDTTGDLVQQLDRINLFIKPQSVYVKTDAKYGESQPEGGYIYKQSGARSDGYTYKISYYAPDKLKENAYLKLDAKGVFVKNWEEVKPEEVPKAALDRMIR